MSSDIVISATDLSKCFHIYAKPIHRLMQILFGRWKQFYGEFWALNPLSFSVKQGEAVGIIGLNGSGKSTLLQLICKTLHPTSGRVTTTGRVAALLELGSGFNPELTGRENIFLYAALFGLSQKEIQQRFQNIEQFADIGEFIEKPIKTYSSGMHVRLAFAVIANIDADILIIDEALSVGDAFFQQKCMRFLRNFRERGTLMFVSHSSSAVISMCDRALWLNKGDLLMDASPQDVTDAYLANLYEMQQGNSDRNFRKKLDVPMIPVDDKEDEILPTEQILSESRRNPSLFEIDPSNMPCFGTGDALIQNITLIDECDHPLSKIYGGEMVTLKMTLIIKNDIDQPIVGFQIKDQLGQVVFGNNSFQRYEHDPIYFQRGELAVASFSFIMPTLKTGAYSIQVAIANGTQDNHIQLHWVYDALIFEVLRRANKPVYFDGFVYVPIIKTEMKTKTLAIS